MTDIDYSKVKLARMSQRLSMDDVVKRMGDKAISKNSISRIERGLLRPSLLTFEAIAEACNVPLDYFYADDFRVSGIDFRFSKDMPTKKTEQVKAAVISEIRKCYSAERQICTACCNLQQFGRIAVSTYDDAEDAAVCLRKKLEIGRQPIFSVYELLMNNGVHIIDMDIEEDSILGLSTFVSGTIPFIIVNSRTNMTTERKRFTALHELAHLMLDIRLLPEMDNNGETSKYNHLPYRVTVKTPTTERLCHHFASAMLLPKESVFLRLGHVRRKLSLKELVSIRNMYGISIAATVHRCHDLAIIDDTEYDNLYDNLINKNIMETGWGEFGTVA